MVPFADCINHENVDVTYGHLFIDKEVTIKEIVLKEKNNEEFLDNSSEHSYDLEDFM